MIEWYVSPELFSVGPISVRWYGLLFAASFILGFKIMAEIYKIEKRPEKDLNDLVWYMILGTIIGARLGHCLFYNPEYYLSNPLEILMVYKGGLASHGAAIGILIALYLFIQRKKEYNFYWLLDRIVLTVALGGSFIRLGNLFNSEIIGTPTDLPWGFVFIYASVSDPLTPRHPAQLYESIAYLISFFILFRIYKTKRQKIQNGFLFGLFLILIFGFRFLIEFIKEDQTYFEEGMLLNMGQLLSIPLIIYGIYLTVTKRPQTQPKEISK